MSENQLEGETKTQTKFEKAKQWFPHMKLMAFGALFVLVLAVAGYFTIYKKDKVVEQKAIQAAEFGVIEAYPQNMSVNSNSEIKIVFNNVVSAHHVQDYIQIYPYYQGTWRQGNTPNEIVFTPNPNYFGGFYQGSNVKVTLLAGLPSDAGKKLAANFSFEFSVKLAGQAMQFRKGRDAYKAATFDSAKGVDLFVDLGDEVKDPKVKMFSAPDEKTFLQDLVYTLTPDEAQYPSNIIWKENARRQIDTASLKEVKTFDVTRSTHITSQETPGIYLFAGYDGDKMLSYTWVFVNKTGVIFKQDDQKVILAAQDLATNKELSGLSATFYQMKDKPTVTGSATINNILQLPRTIDKRVDLVMIKNGSEQMYVPLYLPGSNAEIQAFDDLTKQLSVFVTTDRPIYKPGDTVNYRGVVRIYNDNLYLVPPVNTEVIFVNGLGQQETKVTDASGVFSGSFVIPADRAVNKGYQDFLYINVMDRNEKYLGGTGAEVAAYFKPEYDITVSLDKSDYIKKDVIKATIKGATLTGQPLKNTDVKYVIYRRDFYETEKSVYSESFRINEWGGMCGGGFGFWDDYYGEELKTETVTLNDKGEAYIEFKTADELFALYSEEVTIVAEKVDAANNKISGAGSAVVKAGSFNVFVNNNPIQVEVGKSFTVPFTAETRDGLKIANKEFTYNVYIQKYDDVTQKQTKTTIKTGTVKTDYRGYGYVTESVDKYDTNSYGSYFVEVTSSDEKGNIVGDARYFTLVPIGGGEEYNTGVLLVSSEQNNYVSGDQMVLKINSPDNIRAMVTFERGRVYDAAWVDLKKGESIYNFPVKANYVPSITPTFTFFYDNKYEIEGLRLNVPAMEKLLNVSVSSDKAVYAPGEMAKVTIKVTDANNNPVQADVGAAVVDKAIYVLRKRANPAIHSYFYPMRSRQTNASSSMVGIKIYAPGGGGGGGGGGGTASKLVDTIYWNPNLKTDASGVVTFEVPATDYLTTWRVVTYATTSDTEVGQSEYDYMVNR